MADYKDSQGVKTQRDNEFKIKLVDGQSGTSATKVVTVAQDGDTYVDGTNDFGVPVLTHSSDNKLRLIKSDAAGNIMAVIGNPSGSAVVSDALTHSSVVAAAANNHDKLITSGKTVTKLTATVASLGLFKWQLGTWDGTVFAPIVSGVTSPASPSFSFASIAMPVGDGTLKIRLIATNEDSATNDAYSTLEWIEA